MVLDVVLYHLGRDVAGAAGEISPGPEVLSPVPFLQLRELHLQFSRGYPLDLLEEFRDGYRWRYRDEHVDVVRGNRTGDYFDVEIVANHADLLFRLFSDSSFEDLEPVLGYPDDVQGDAVERMGSLAVIGVHERDAFTLQGGLYSIPRFCERAEAFV